MSRGIGTLFWLIGYWIGRGLGQTDRRIVNAYLLSVGQKKLHIGCGDNVLEGWLNSDYFPKDREILHIDATRRFPLKEGQFDYVFSEHMIEHIPYAHGAIMLSECHRVLRSNGKIRISTPDLAFLMEIYRTKDTDFHAAYRTWSKTEYGLKSDAAAFVVNNFFRNWGHQFIYDKTSLRNAMENAGFVNITSYALNESEDEALANLENEQRMPDGYLRLETFTLEGRKPARG